MYPPLPNKRANPRTASKQDTVSRIGDRERPLRPRPSGPRNRVSSGDVLTFKQPRKLDDMDKGALST
ncbi:hypothetical protein BDQ17DRAFT_1357614 [Cyathus striatus]|nr:hypothetical protein BDQ17DRAFT_1357614 [Cyathus striatus]